MAKLIRVYVPKAQLSLSDLTPIVRTLRDAGIPVSEDGRRLVKGTLLWKQDLDFQDDLLVVWQDEGAVIGHVKTVDGIVPIHQRNQSVDGLPLAIPHYQGSKVRFRIA